MNRTMLGLALTGQNIHHIFPHIPTVDPAGKLTKRKGLTILANSLILFGGIFDEQGAFWSFVFLLAHALVLTFAGFVIFRRKNSNKSYGSELCGSLG